MSITIESVKPLHIDRFLFVKITRSDGIVGWGEAGAWGYVEPTIATIEKIAASIIGHDATRIEQLQDRIRRTGRFSGAIISAAMSAIDIALWDAQGKSLGVPVYELIGGKVRDKVRLYHHAYGTSRDALVADSLTAKQSGYTAVGHVNPLLDSCYSTASHESYASRIEEANSVVGELRERLGNSMDIALEFHRRLRPTEARAMLKALEEYHPLFAEDPLPPDEFTALASIVESTTIPIASGERLTSLESFSRLISEVGATYIRPSVTLCGGISSAIKVSSIAEATGAQLVPHNPLGAVSAAASLQLAATLRTVSILEWPSSKDPSWVDMPGYELFVPEQFTIEDGYLSIPDRPGLGIEIDEETLTRFASRFRPLQTRCAYDGSVIDH